MLETNSARFANRELPWRNGNNALASEVQSYAAPLFAFLYRLLGDIHTAELLVEDVLLEFFRHPARRSHPNMLVTLYGIAAEAAARYLSVKPPDPPAHTFPHLPTIGRTTKEPARHRKLEFLLERLFELPLPQRAAVLMHKYDCLDYLSIAWALHLDEAAAAALVRDGYRQLCGAAKVS
jgi:DNA-directed RNA polymerase specialized sigma24 family protein